ncbi:MAG: hypothetical protein JW958_01470 [Candidatus Eisenbacteria bacterium]|nr:hypothetical protein [Candidatus Eisenbacteria bacterium]
MEKQGPNYDEGHLFVAAIRILRHREQRPPTVEETAEFLGHAREVGYLLARGLAEKGIVDLVENPFETHLEIRDHLALENLPREEKGPGFGEDLEEFRKRKEKERDELGAFFASGGESETKKKKLDALGEAFRKYRNAKSGEEEEEGGEE